MDNIKYIPEDFFLVRTPLKRSEDYNFIYRLKSDKNLLSSIVEDEIIREAIAIASLDLNASLDYSIGEELRPKVLESLEKYLNRLTTRATPFGLFAALAAGSFANKSNITLSSDIKLYKKSCTVDMGWFCSIIKILEEDRNILFNTHVIFNRQCYLSGNRVKNPYISNYGQINETMAKSTSIKKTNQVLFVKIFAQEYVAFKELYNELLRRNQDVPEEVIFNFLIQLIKTEFLITDLRIRTGSHDPLQELIYKMTDYDLDEPNKILYAKLDNINRHRIEYSEHNIGQGLNYYIDLCNKMSEIKDSKNYLNVSTAAHMQNNKLNKVVKVELERLSDFLVSITTEDNESYPIKVFKLAFVEKYGANVEIPLLELMDWDMGIGDPYSQKFVHNSSKESLSLRSEKYRFIEKLIHDKIQLCLRKGLNEVVLNNKDIEAVSDYSDILDFAYSFSLNTIILAEDSNSIDQGNFQLMIGPNVGSDQAGNSFNRFYNILDDDTKKKLHKIYKNEINETEHKYAIVDAYELNHTARYMNICNGNDNYRYSINMAYGVADESRRIDLDDIFIGFDPRINRLYIKSRKLGTIVKVSPDNMLNTLGSNSIIRLLRDISYSYENHPVESLLQFQLYTQDYKYIPQIRYGRTILFSETWKIEKTDFTAIKSFEGFREEARILFKLWGIPRFVYVVKFDQCILIDTENDTFMHYLFKELRNNTEAIIIRQAESEKSLWLSNSKGDRFFSELTVPFRLNQIRKENFEIPSGSLNNLLTKTNYNKNKAEISFIDNIRLIIPGQENWIYFKIYCQPENADIIIGNNIKQFVDLHRQSLKKYFFIRYSDPNFHIRIRFKTQEKEEVSRLLESFAQWYEEIRSAGLSYRYNIDVYEKELERYGGIRAMERAENLFYNDSIFVMLLINSQWRKNKGDDEIGIVSIFHMLKEFLNDKHLIEYLLCSYISQNDHKKEFRENRELLLRLFNYNISDIDQDVQIALQQRAVSIHEYKELLDDLDTDELLTNSIENIIASHLHMFCNRFKGDRVWEQKVSAFSRHIIYTLNTTEKFNKSLL